MQGFKARLLVSFAVVIAAMCLPAYAQRTTGNDCGGDFLDCFVSTDTHPALGSGNSADPASTGAKLGLAAIAFRTNRGGPFAHHWVEVQTSAGRYTLGFGPALIPFIDRGEISVEDARGHIEWKYLLHPFSLHWNFARAPGLGRNIGKVVYLPIAKADALVEKQRRRRFVWPYIPFFHDCRTYVCALQASTEGKSSLPCYLLLKGYW